MRGTARTVAIAGISAAALFAAGCGGGSEEPSADGGDTGKAGGSITVYGCNPENPYVPNNTGESCGHDVVSLVTSKLVHYKTADGTPELDIAESIETSDNTNFTVKIKKGYKFHDGTEVKAKNFVDAWNYTAYAPNAFYGNYFFDAIEGWTDLNPEADKDGKAPTPKVDKMSGLKVVDDYTFTIKTAAPVSNLQTRLGYESFAPLPDAFFKDPKAYGEKPIGAGPYKFDSWTKSSEVKLSKFADYSGSFGGKVDNITFKIYDEAEAAYNDLISGQLDISDNIPPSALIDGKWKTDLNNRIVEKPVGIIQVVSFPPVKNNKKLVNPKLRQAISMAIDRETITKQIFNGGRTPADSFVAPVVDGYKKGACGEICTYNPEKAKALLAEAGGYDQKLTVAYNADSPHKDWIEAMCNGIKQTLGIDCVGAPSVDFDTFLELRNERKINGMFRSGWQMDYPSIQNFLEPIYVTGAGANDSDYSNKEFDAKVKEAAAATDPAQANTLYQEAEQILFKDLPAIPLWYNTGQMGWSDKVASAELDAFGTPDLTTVTVK